MPSCEQELIQLKHYQTALAGRLEQVETELQRLLSLTHDDKSLLNSARQILEILLKEICREAGWQCPPNQMVGSMLDKFGANKPNAVVPTRIPEHIFRAMRHINDDTPAGSHPTEYSPKQTRQVLTTLDTVLHWFVTEYKNWPLAETPPPPANSRLLATFVGRESELAQLETALQGDTPVVVEGMAGVGKSWLVDYFHSQRRDRFPCYPKLSLNDPRQPGTLKDWQAELAGRLKVGLNWADIRAALQGMRCLVHLENVDATPAAGLAEELARELAGCSLVISGRLRELNSGKGGWQRVQLGVLPENDALQQLEKELSPVPLPGSSDKLVRELGCLPLAIHLAAGHLRVDADVEKFLRRLHKTKLALKPTDLTEHQERLMLQASLNLSLELLHSTAPEYWTEDPTQALVSLAHSPAEGVRTSLALALVGWADQDDGEEFLRHAYLCCVLDCVDEASEEERKQGKTLLRWKIHPLLAELLRPRLSDAAGLQTRLDDWFLSRLPLPENEAGYTAWHALNAEQPALAAWLRGVPLQRGAEIIRAASWYAMLNGPFPLWQAWCESLLSGDCDDAARSNILWTLGQTARSAGDVQRALTAAEEQAALDKTRGADRDYALARGLSADLLQARGQLDEALRIRREEEMPVYERLGDVRSRAVTLGQIADILQARGEWDEALRIRREEEMPVYERLGDVRSRAVTLGQIADILQARGEWDEALRIRREEEMPVFERLGDVRERAITLGKIADIYEGRGKRDEALRILREEQMPVYERLGDVRGLLVARTYLAFGLMQLDPPQAEEAGALLRLALAEAQRMQIPEAGQIEGIMVHFGLA